MLDCSYVLSSYISYRRNIKDMPFVKTLTESELAIGVSRSLSEIFGEELEFKSLKNIPLSTCLKLKEDGIFSDELIENKDISAYATNQDMSRLIFINEQDHVKIVARENGLNLEKCFKESMDMDDKLLDKLEMAFDINLGYLTSNPKFVGTGMEVGVLMFIPAIIKNNKLKKIQNELLKEEFEALCPNGKPWSSGPFVLFKNRYTFGHKENEFAEKMQKLIEKIQQIEVLEENNSFNLSASGLTDNIFRAYGIATNCYRISYDEAEEKIGYILWGIRLKMLKYKKNAKLFEFLNSLKENHLGEKLSVKEQEKLRANKLSKYILDHISKGEVDV